jgi:hypothetical protein
VGWIFCRKLCDPTLYALDPFGFGTIGNDFEFPNECPGCNVCFINFSFASQEIAELIVGEGNYSVVGSSADEYWETGEWVLFYDDGDYVRDPSRPVPCTVETITHPDDSTLDLVVSVSVNGGAFVWTRRSTDSSSDDFHYFDLTSGEIDISFCECERGSCLSISLERHRVAFAWEDPPEDFVAEVTMVNGEEECAFYSDCLEDFTSPVCLTFDPDYVASVLGTVDGWGFGGRWRWGDYYEGVDEYQCPEAATLTINGELTDECETTEGDVHVGEFVAANSCCELRLRWEGCDRDPRDPPTAADFTVELSDTCPESTLDTLEYGGECEEEGGEINCPPEDCLAGYCKWQWDVDAQEWVLIFSSCVEDVSECPDPPDEPLIPEVVWAECKCCNVITPPGPCGEGQECDGSCNWVWFGFWVGSACPDDAELGSCTCCGKPGRDGLFFGEVVAGVCCDAPFGTGCAS